MKTIGTISAVLGALLVALNIGDLIGSIGYILFLISSITLLYSAIALRDIHYILIQSTFLITNLLGLIMRV